MRDATLRSGLFFHRVILGQTMTPFQVLTVSNVGIDTIGRLKLSFMRKSLLAFFFFMPTFSNVFFLYRIGAETVDLLDKLLTLDPTRRITAVEALDHEWFWSDPMPADPKTLVLLHCFIYCLTLFNLVCPNMNLHTNSTNARKDTCLLQCLLLAWLLDQLVFQEGRGYNHLRITISHPLCIIPMPILPRPSHSRHLIVTDTTYLLRLHHLVVQDTIILLIRDLVDPHHSTQHRAYQALIQ